MEKIQLKKGGAIYNVVETDLKGKYCEDWKETDKGIRAEIPMVYPSYGDALVYVWLPKWAVKCVNKKIELWLTDKMDNFNVYNVDVKESIQMNQKEFIEAIEKY